jgi:hypothetical protein
MALATELPTAILVRTSSAVRVWRLYGAVVDHICRYDTVSKEEVYEYVALTKTLAQTTADAASQEGIAAGAVASYEAVEDQRTIGSYRLIKTITYADVTTMTLEDYPE